MAMRTRLWAMLREHRWIAIGGGTAVIVAAVLVIVFVVGGGGQQPIHYANYSRNFKVCLLDQTHDDADAAMVWKAVQTAKASAPINAQQMTVPTGKRIDPAPYLNGLIALRCELIITNGPGLADAVRAGATAHPGTNFVTVGDPVALPNVHAVSTPITSPQSLTDEILTAQRTWAQH